MEKWPADLSPEALAQWVEDNFQGTLMGHLGMQVIEVSRERAIVDLPFHPGITTRFDRSWVTAPRSPSIRTIVPSSIRIRALRLVSPVPSIKRPARTLVGESCATVSAPSPNSKATALARWRSGHRPIIGCLSFWPTSILPMYSFGLLLLCQ